MKRLLLSMAVVGALALNLTFTPAQAQSYGEPKTITFQQDTPVPAVLQNLKANFQLVGAQPLAASQKFMVIGAVNQAQQPVLIVLIAGTQPGTVSKVIVTLLPPDDARPTTTI